MGDLTDIQASQSVKIVGSDTSGAETNTVKVSSNNDVHTADVLNASAVYANLAVTTSPAELKVGGSALSNRKYIHLQPKGNSIFWGYSNSVSSANGTEVFKDQLILLPVGPNIAIWLVASSGTINVRIGELS